MKRNLFYGGLLSYALGMLLCYSYITFASAPTALAQSGRQREEEDTWVRLPIDSAQNQRLARQEKELEKYDSRIAVAQSQINDLNIQINRARSDIDANKFLGIVFGLGMMFLQAIQVMLWAKVKKNGRAEGAQTF